MRKEVRVSAVQEVQKRELFFVAHYYAAMIRHLLYLHIFFEMIYRDTLLLLDMLTTNR